MPLAVYFENIAKGVPKLEAAETVAKGCFLKTRSILKWGNEFCSEVSKRRTTSEVTQPDGTTKYVRKFKAYPKPRFQFGPILRNYNRGVNSLMNDERIRARARVWLRINARKKKGKPNLRCKHFQHYLQTDLLRHTGRHALTHTCTHALTH